MSYSGGRGGSREGGRGEEEEVDEGGQEPFFFVLSLTLINNERFNSRQFPSVPGSSLDHL
jgi:hypothetical protein